MSDGLQMKYFVLKPAGDDPYAQASRNAMREYAKYVRHENPSLALDIEKWAINEQGEANKHDLKRRLSREDSAHSGLPDK